MSYTTYPTHIATWDNCRYQYYLRYILRVTNEITSSNLVFGKTIHSILEQIIYHFENEETYNAEDEFVALWNSAVDEEPVEYSSAMNRVDMEECGAYLATEFSKKWIQFELSPLIDGSGNLFLEKKLSMQLAPGFYLGAILDFAGINPDNKVIILDFKTPKAEACDEHVMGDNQIMAQQMVLDANKQEYGIEKVDHIGFIDLFKKKIPVPLESGKYRKDATWPRVNDPKTIKRHDDHSIIDFKQKLLWMYEDREKGRFPKTPRGAYNTPCGMCDYAQYCTTGSKEGLVFPKNSHVKLAV